MANESSVPLMDGIVIAACSAGRTFQTTAIVPAFRELRARNIFATVQKLACCQTCAHGDLSQRHTSYLFFHVQDKDCCIETPTSQPLKLYLGLRRTADAVTRLRP